MDLSDLLAWPRRSEVPGMLFRRLISRHSLRGIHGMTRAEQVFWLVFELCGEVTSGGVDQFFGSSSGERAPLVPGALRELGRVELAAEVERGLRHFPRGTGRPELHEVVSSLSPEARAELEALGRQVEAVSEGLLEDLVQWIGAHRADITLSNAGLAAFRPVTVPESLGVQALLELPADVSLPALYVRASRRPARNGFERSLMLATHAFGEISDEGGVSYLFCAKAAHAPEARDALEAAGARGAAAIVTRVMATLPAPFPTDVVARRQALAALSDDATTKLRALQWELDELRMPTITALHSWARRNREALQ